MSNIPSVAVVLEGGIVKTTLVEGWPGQLPLPHIVVVDYDTEGVAENELTQFSIGNEILEAWCYAETPDVYEAFRTPALSPRSVLSALGEAVDAAVASPLDIARRLRREVLELDRAIHRYQRPPDGSDYNELIARTIAGLAQLLMSLGDTSPSDA